MKVTLRDCGQPDIEIEVIEGQSIASAAQEQGLRLYGPCYGAGACAGCRRIVREGIEYLFDRVHKGPPRPAGNLGEIRTCLTSVNGEGAVINLHGQYRTEPCARKPVS